MQLSQHQTEAILSALSELNYGKVTVTVAETNRVVDIVTEKRRRVPQDSETGGNTGGIPCK